MSISLQTKSPVSFQKKVAPQQKSFNNVVFQGQPQQATFQKSTTQNTSSNVSFNGFFSFIKKDPIEQLFKKNEGLKETVDKVLTADDKAINEFNELKNSESIKKEDYSKLFSHVIKTLKSNIVSGENVSQAAQALVKMNAVGIIARQKLHCDAYPDIRITIGPSAYSAQHYENARQLPVIMDALFSEANPLHKEAREQYDSKIRDILTKPKITGMLLADATLKEQALNELSKNASSVKDLETIMEFIKGPDRIYGSLYRPRIGIVTENCDLDDFKADAIKSLPDVLDKINAGKAVRSEVQSELRDIIDSDPDKDVKLTCYEVLDKF